MDPFLQTYGKLNGLKNLTTLRLEKSRLKGLETEALRAVPRLKRLLMAYCSGLPSIPVETLKGKYGLLCRIFSSAKENKTG
jgi:hypothetical protein